MDPRAVIELAATSPLISRLQISIDEATASRVTGWMPVEGNTQPFGALHGGATAALCESLASIGALLGCAPTQVPAGIELSISHLKSVRKGAVTASATPLQQGRRTAVWEVRVHDDTNALIGLARVTCVLIAR